MATGSITNSEKKREKTIAGYTVCQNMDNSIEVSKELIDECGSVKAALRKLSKEVGFNYEHDWTVQQLGRKLLVFAEEMESKGNAECSTCEQNASGNASGSNISEDVESEEMEEADEWIDQVGEIAVDNIHYTLYDDGSAEADSFEVDDYRKNIIIPSKVSYKGKDYKVKTFSIEDGEYEQIQLPETIAIVSGNAFLEMGKKHSANLKVFIEKNENIIIEDGIIYSKGYKGLQNTVLMNPTNEFTVRNGVEYIYYYALGAHDEIEILNVPSSVKHIILPFSEESNLKTVNIHNSKGAVAFDEETEDEPTFPNNANVNYLGD